MLSACLSTIKLISISLLCVPLIFCIGCEEIELPDLTTLPPDSHPAYDSDGDGISNAVELNSANAYLNLDTSRHDPNPSIAHGQPCNGSLENGLNMVNTGTGYYHYNPEKIDYDDWGVLHLINMIEGAGRDWYNNSYIPPRIGIGDLSLRYGGYWPDHSCHQNGLEVDIRYVRNDGLDIGLNLSTQDSLYFDKSATIALMNYLFNNSNSVKIYVGTYLRGKIIFSGIDTVYDSNHNDHFHLRIQDPDGTGN